MVDDYSRLTWVFLMRSKSEIFTQLSQFITQSEIQFETKVKIIRSDNGSEFFNSICNDYFDSKSIAHQSSCAYIPQQNGIVERKHRHILDTTRALMFQSYVPLKYWG